MKAVTFFASLILASAISAAPIMVCKSTKNSSTQASISKNNDPFQGITVKYGKLSAKRYLEGYCSRDPFPVPGAPGDKPKNTTTILACGDLNKPVKGKPGEPPFGSFPKSLGVSAKLLRNNKSKTYALVVTKSYAVTDPKSDPFFPDKIWKSKVIDILKCVGAR